MAQEMIKPKRLCRGDTVAIVSLSSGMGGDAAFKHRYTVGKKRLETEFGLNVVTMPNALKGSDYLCQHPKARADDLMAAFNDNGIRAIFSMIGGDDTVRLLPYIDFDVIRCNPKIFIGYSDTTVNHFMMYKAGLVSLYGPSILAEFAENVAMHDYTKRYVYDILFEPKQETPIIPSPSWTTQRISWADESNNSIQRTMTDDAKGFELLQGIDIARGKLIGGCVDVFSMIIGTEIWPDMRMWQDAILFIETSEDCPAPNDVMYVLRGMAAQGIIDNLSGIVVGKPCGEKYYDEYKAILRQIAAESHRPDGLICRFCIMLALGIRHPCVFCHMGLWRRLIATIGHSALLSQQLHSFTS